MSNGGGSNPKTFGQYAIYLIIAVAIIAVVYFGAQAMGVAIPPIFVTIFWILAVAFILVAAIRLLLKM